MPQSLGYDWTKDQPSPVQPANQNRPTFYTPPPPPGGGVSQSQIDLYNAATLGQLSDVQRDYAAAINAASGSTSAQRQAYADQLKFGLQGLRLDRRSANLDRRDAVEAAINNALQRGIYNSGVRMRNEARAGERADITDARINLNEQELRASIKNALAALNAQNKQTRTSYDLEMGSALEQIEMQRRQQLGELVDERGGIYQDQPIMTVQPGGYR